MISERDDIEIKGVGIDIVNIARIKNILKYPFVEKILSEYELENTSKKLSMDPLFLSQVFAAKEAVVKAIGSGFVGISFKDITVYFEGNWPYAKIGCDFAGSEYKFNLKFEYKTLENSSLFYVISRCIATRPEHSGIDLENMSINRSLFCLSEALRVDIDSIDKSLFSDSEKKLRIESKVANIAAKKAILSFVGLGNNYEAFKSISIVRNGDGSPGFFTDNMQLKIKLEKYNIYLSLAHEKELAVSYVVLQSQRGVYCGK